MNGKYHAAELNKSGIQLDENILKPSRANKNQVQIVDFKK